LSGGVLNGKNRLIFDRSSTIPSLFLGKKLRIHKGQFFRGLLVNKFVLGYKFGEFSYSRKPFKFLSKKKAKKK
jgi:ribosomal protein S19